MEAIDVLTKEERGYLAGWFDRWGTISILRHERMQRGKERVEHTLALTLTALERRKGVLEHWRILTGLGSITYNREGKFWLWRIVSRQAEQFLQAVWPLLMFQPDRAAMALRFRTTKRPGPQRVTDEVLAERETCRDWLMANVGNRRKLEGEESSFEPDDGCGMDGVVVPDDD